MVPMDPRFAVFLGLLTATASMSARAQQASPREVACHGEGTKRYIEDFRRLGAPQQEPAVTVTTFINDKLKYEEYYAECMARWNSSKGR